jgi:hypothetical protein
LNGDTIDLGSEVTNPRIRDMQSSETMEAAGTLQLTGGGPVIPVNYSLTFRRWTRPIRPGLPPVVGMGGSAMIATKDGSLIPEGFYFLTTAQAEKVRMQKLGAGWHILARLGT